MTARKEYLSDKYPVLWPDPLVQEMAKAIGVVAREHDFEVPDGARGKVFDALGAADALTPVTFSLALMNAYVDINDVKQTLSFIKNRNFTRLAEKMTFLMADPFHEHPPFRPSVFEDVEVQARREYLTYAIAAMAAALEDRHDRASRILGDKIHRAVEQMIRVNETLTEKGLAQMLPQALLKTYLDICDKYAVLGAQYAPGFLLFEKGQDELAASVSVLRDGMASDEAADHNVRTTTNPALVKKSYEAMRKYKL